MACTDHPHSDCEHDSKWIEIYQYDVSARPWGMEQDAKRLFDKFTAISDKVPREDSHWFRDWYYPIYRDPRQSRVLCGVLQAAREALPDKVREQRREQSRTPGT